MSTEQEKRLRELAHDFVTEFCGGSETVEGILDARLVEAALGATPTPSTQPTLTDKEIQTQSTGIALEYARPEFRIRCAQAVAALLHCARVSQAAPTEPAGGAQRVTGEMIRNAWRVVGPSSTDPHFDWPEWWDKQAAEINKALAAAPLEQGTPPVVTLRMLNLALARARWGGPFDPQYAVDHLNEELKLAAGQSAASLSADQVQELRNCVQRELDEHIKKDGVLRDLTCPHCSLLLGKISAYENVLALLRSQGQPAGATGERKENEQVRRNERLST